MFGLFVDWESNTTSDGLDPFPNTPFWDHPEFKEAADDKKKFG